MNSPDKTDATASVQAMATPAKEKDGREESTRIPYKPNPHPSFFSRLFFFDASPLIKCGLQGIEPENLLDLDTFKTGRLYDTFDEAWQEELASGKPNIRKALLKGNVLVLLWTAFLYAVSQACTFAGPLLLQEIVKGLACRQNVPEALVDEVCVSENRLYIYAGVIIGAPAIISLCENHLTYSMGLLGCKLRNALMAAIYRKCLRASGASLQAESTGKIVTLMSNDAQKLQDVTLALHPCWGSPLYIVAIMVFLWDVIGWASLVGAGAMLMLGPLTGIVASKLVALRKAIIGYTDKRVTIMNEIVAGIRVLKYYAWETPFMKSVREWRAREAEKLRSQAYLSALFAMVLMAGPVAVGIFSFGSYGIAGKDLTTADAYAALAYFSMLRFPMSFLPLIISQLINANIGLNRIQGFLMRAEAEEQEDDGGVPRGAVEMKGATLSWYDADADAEAEQEAGADAGGKRKRRGEKKKSKADEEGAEKSTKSSRRGGVGPALRDVTLSAKPGQLVVVAGGVGSGKSSLLAALIGGINRTAGTVHVGGSLAYVAQTAWILNATVRDNITCGEKWNPERYELAVQVSQLEQDLEILPDGDQTEIGERGINLSGGQKQRVSIARAVYADADVYVLDDPLSAVDSHVGRAIFEECICGALKPKTVVLVTNALHCLPEADTVLWLEDGRVAAQGTYDELIASGLDVAEILKRNIGSDDADDDSDTKTEKIRAEATRDPARSKSTASVASSRGTANLTGIEEREAGAVSSKVVKAYSGAAGGALFLVPLALLFAWDAALRVGTDYWLGVWTEDRVDGKGMWFYLGIYTAFGIVYSLAVFVRSVFFYRGSVRAAVNLHNDLLVHVLRLPMSFFDTNPSGRIINRFSRDVEILDSVLPNTLVQFLGCIASLAGTFVLITIASYWFPIALTVLVILYFIIQRYYIPAARDLQRLESVTRSPIYSHFSEAVNGVATIRAYKRQDWFIRSNDAKVDANAAAYISQKLAAAWLSMRLDALGLVVIACGGVLSIAGNVDAALAGLILVYVLEVSKFTKHMTNMASLTEQQLNSVERIVQYLEPPTEAAPDTEDPKTKAVVTAPGWPAQGRVQVDTIMMRYRPTSPLVLRGVSFTVEAGEKVGICGRTGSGKSSLFVMLFRLVEPASGTVYIDGVDYRAMGLADLRSKMAMIPQDPFMFTGTVRTNLDPFEEHTDARIWEAVEAVGLKPAVDNLEAGMDAPVVDSGANFSQGERQLFCLARALLRGSKILMMDEATASVDMETDALIQRAVREKFTDCTVLTIAHRLNTIMDSDRILVMDDGLAAEYREPAELCEDEQSLLSKLIDNTGKKSAAMLRRLATEASKSRKAAKGPRK
ncbi:unnamed protein product [Pedinophyceae sp. YPF-701]|nr:unnamed protein product [Pedinophyceae sp. YPF-701]